MTDLPIREHESGGGAKTERRRQFVACFLVHLPLNGRLQRLTFLDGTTDGGPVIRIDTIPIAELQQDPSSIVDKKKSNRSTRLGCIAL